jgi:hypothetical protein
MAKEVIEQEPKTVSNHRNWVNGAVAALIVILIFLAGTSFANHHRQDMQSKHIFATQGGPFGAGLERGTRGGMHGTLGDSTTSNGETHLSGVVTAVNGDSFTVAGSGATTSVTTNSSTQYKGGNTVKQNDTVIVVGTSANGTLTATNVVINP